MRWRCFLEAEKGLFCDQESTRAYVTQSKETDASDVRDALLEETAWKPIFCWRSSL